MSRRPVFSVKVFLKNFKLGDRGVLDFHDITEVNQFSGQLTLRNEADSLIKIPMDNVSHWVEMKPNADAKRT